MVLNVTRQALSKRNGRNLAVIYGKHFFFFSLSAARSEFLQAQPQDSGAADALRQHGARGRKSTAELSCDWVPLPECHFPLRYHSPRVCLAACGLQLEHKCCRKRFHKPNPSNEWTSPIFHHQSAFSIGGLLITCFPGNSITTPGSLVGLKAKCPQ